MTLLMRHFLLSVVICGIWDLACPLCTLHFVRILSRRITLLFRNIELFSLKIGRRGARSPRAGNWHALIGGRGEGQM